MRALWGGSLLAAVWLLWPGPAEIDRDGRWAGRADSPAAVSAHGLGGPPGIGIAMSVKGQISGDTTVSRARVEGRLRQLASAEAARDMTSRDEPDAPVARPPATPAEPEATDSAKIDRPALRAAPRPDATVAAEQAVGRAPSGAVGTTGPQGSPDAEPPAPAPPRSRVMPAPVSPGVVVEPPAIVLAEPAAGPVIEIVRPGAIGSQVEQPQQADTSNSGAALVRSAAAAASAPELSHRPSDATTSDRAAAQMVAAPVARAGQPPTWLRNAVAPAIYEGPMIAIVIDDLGMNRSGTAALNRLRAPLTLAFLPYAPELDEQTRAARAAGHELLVHVPMEPTGGEWPGPHALTSQLGSAELTSRLRAHLRSFRGFVGINNHMGSRVTADAERMDTVMAELRKHDLLFLDSRTAPGSVAGREARRWQVPYAERDVFLDNEIELTAVLRQFVVVENIARRRGYAVAIGHPHKVTIEALRRWLPTLDARGLALAPISAIVARRYCVEDGPAPVDACTHYTATASLMP